MKQLLGFAVLLSSCVFTHSTLSAQPNILFILCDELGFGDLGCYGQQQTKNVSGVFVW